MHSSQALYSTTPLYTENITATFQSSIYQYCGANDCQNAEIVEESIDQYVPTNQITLYVLTGSFLVIMMIGLICHIIFLPEMLFSEFNQTEGCERKDEETEEKSLKKVCL